MIELFRTLKWKIYIMPTVEVVLNKFWYLLCFVSAPNKLSKWNKAADDQYFVRFSHIQNPVEAPMETEGSVFLAQNAIGLYFELFNLVNMLTNH
jgi:hypothetical protein